MTIIVHKSALKKALIVLFYSIIGLFLLLFTIGAWGLKPLLTKRIQTAVLTATDGLYYLEFKALHYDILAGNAQVLQVNWRADTAMYPHLRKNKKMPDNIYQGKVGEIKLTGLHPWTIFFSKKLHLNAIIIQQPTVEIMHQKQPYNSFKTAQSPYQIISKFVQSFAVANMKVDNINVTYTNLQNPKKPQRSKIEHLDLEVFNFLIDSTAHRDKKRFYYTKECIFKLKKIDFPSEDSLNTLKINALIFSTLTRSLTIKNVVYEPKYPPFRYGDVTKGQDRIGIVCHDIQLDDINLQKLFVEKKIYAHTLKVNHGKVNVFTDTRIFNSPRKANYRPYPHQAFAALSVKFLIDTLLLKNFNITYSEYNPETQLVGNVKFRQVHGSFMNLTNDTIPLQRNPHCLLFLRAKLMNKADMFLKFNFNLASSKAAFSASGAVANMNANVVNQVLEALVMAKAETGFIEKFFFKMQGDKFGLKGSAVMIYRDLSVMIFKNPKEHGAFKKRKVLSFIANSFIIKHSNPIRKKPIRVAQINYKRVPEKAFFYTLWKGLVEGIKGSVL